MPELPEVQRAVNLIKRVGLGKRITHVDTAEDSIVFADTTHSEFAQELNNRKITNVQRYGKQFYIELDGKGRLPLLHFGMTGMLHVRGEIPLFYKEGPKKIDTNWPPRFMKFVLHLESDEPKDASTSNAITELAFTDPRRLGRIRLRNSPRTEPPISDLGFDPILSMPSLEDFSAMVLKRSCPIKALLLDQSFNAGVGNWVADEILYHSRVHPEQRCNTLTSEQISNLHHQTKHVCETAVSVDADDSKFPEDWLFKHRWGKGKREKPSLKLPTGGLATIKWITVGGRTSAFVTELQKYTGNPDLPSPKTPSSKKRSRGSKRTKKVRAKEEEEDEGESDLTSLSDEEFSSPKTPSKKRPRGGKSSKTRARVEQEDEEESDLTALSDEEEPLKSSPAPKRKVRMIFETE
ncbi:AtMMH-1 [Dendrothele bispora CBS 962.96]|uniref:AtMMH-1 n=1 Tax=Dendrothele bispora (strain CBS 962.96) TaxID=1314807 RepID=A0A4V4HC98_DENBC|nr:AtMMH-1 [Dendrothele bispora CBS 962.96]